MAGLRSSVCTLYCVYVTVCLGALSGSGFENVFRLSWGPILAEASVAAQAPPYERAPPADANSGAQHPRPTVPSQVPAGGRETEGYADNSQPSGAGSPEVPRGQKAEPAQVYGHKVDGAQNYGRNTDDQKGSHPTYEQKGGRPTHEQKRGQNYEQRRGENYDQRRTENYEPQRGQDNARNQSYEEERVRNYGGNGEENRDTRRVHAGVNEGAQNNDPENRPAENRPAENRPAENRPSRSYGEVEPENGGRNVEDNRYKGAGAAHTGNTEGRYEGQNQRYEENQGGNNQPNHDDVNREPSQRQNNLDETDRRITGSYDDKYDAENTYRNHRYAEDSKHYETRNNYAGQNEYEDRNNYAADKKYDTRNGYGEDKKYEARNTYGEDKKYEARNTYGEDKKYEARNTYGEDKYGEKRAGDYDKRYRGRHVADSEGGKNYRGKHVEEEEPRHRHDVRGVYDSSEDSVSSEDVKLTERHKRKSYSSEERPVGPMDTLHSMNEEGKIGGEGNDMLIQEWEKHMQNFVPDMLVTFQLRPRAEEFFYQDVTTTPLYIRGGYFVSSGDDGGVEFSVTDPSHEVITKKTDAEGLFYFEAKMAGTYAFCIFNKKWVDSRSVTFAIGPGMDHTLQPSHLVSLDINADRVQRQLKDIQVQSQILWFRQKSHLKELKSTEGKVFYFSLLELFVLLTVSGAQIYYIKSLVSDQRIL